MKKSKRKKPVGSSGPQARCGEPGADKCPQGFTLVELAVVLACTALLVVTLIPAFAGTKPNNLAFQCLNNLRQWGDASGIMTSDNNDMLARDGTDSSGQYAVDTGNSPSPGVPATWPGTPLDAYAWFNVLPPAMGEQPLSSYYMQPGANGRKKYPFPGNGKGQIWLCPAAKAATNDLFLNGGVYGLFSYAFNIDLKLNRNIANGVLGNSALYPNMPKLGALRGPAATVLFSDVAFSPSWETSTPGPSRNGIYPCARWSAFPRRHNNGGTLLFTDGHSAVFKWDYVFNQNPTPSLRNEKLNPDIIWNPNRDIP